MTKKMLIDAAHPEETRIVVTDGSRVEEFDYETAAKATLSGNIYLAKVTRLEPSLQAAFVDYGGGRHGFLAFSEIHPDYYQIPAADRAALIAAERQAEAEMEREQEEAEARRHQRASRNGSDESGVKNGGKNGSRSGADKAAAKNGKGRNRRRTRGRRGDAEISDDRMLAPSLDFSEIELPPALLSAVEDGGPLADATTVAGAPSLAEIDEILAATAPETVSAALEAERKVIAARADADAEIEGDADEAEAPDLEPQEVGPWETGATALDETPLSALAPTQPESAAETPRAAAEAASAAWRETAHADAEPLDDAAAAVAPALEDAAAAAADADAEPPAIGDAPADEASTDMRGEGDGEDAIEEIGEVAAEPSEEARLEARRRLQRLRDYKIQEVIKRRQIMLVQVIKEERGNKGAALTTYLSLAGRYCVLMPNTARGGGVSRKITNAADRKRLKAIAGEFEVPEGMGLIVRTAGANRTRAEMQRDYEYLLRQWSSIRDLTLKSIAPTLIYEEGSLIKRSIRDLYGKEIDSITVEGEAGYAEARDYMGMLLPNHIKHVEPYRGRAPLFVKHQVESQISSMLNPTVQLKSGGYIVIGVTEALVAIDVNSGRSTKEASIENTALKTNLEAADEISRQLRLRDLAGLIVIDFIDMEDPKNNRAVEKRLKEKLKTDRARIQVGRISGFGLLEMSRQRLRPGLLEATTSCCPHCRGTGVVRSNEASALTVLRALEEAALGARLAGVRLIAPIAVANYILNAKRERIADLEDRCDLRIFVEASPEMWAPDFKIERIRQTAREDEGHPGRVSGAAAIQVEAGYRVDDEEADDVVEAETAREDSRREDSRRDDSRREEGRREDGGRRRGGGRRDAEAGSRGEERRDRRRRNGAAPVEDAVELDAEAELAADADEDAEATADGAATFDADADPDGDAGRRKRRGRRGGRRRRKGEGDGDGEMDGAAVDPMPVIDLGDDDAEAEPEPAAAQPADIAASAPVAAASAPVVEPEPESAPEPAPVAAEDASPDRAAARPSRRLADFFKDAGLSAAPAEPAEREMAAPDAPPPPPASSKPRRTGWWAFRRG